MAKITIKKAEKILSTARSWSVQNGTSDVAIARRLHEFNKDLGYLVCGASIACMFHSIDKIYELGGLIVGLTGLTWAFHLLRRSHAFSQIRAIFDSAGPQSLAEIKLSTNHENHQ